MKILFHFMFHSVFLGFLFLNSGRAFGNELLFYKQMQMNRPLINIRNLAYASKLERTYRGFRITGEHCMLEGMYDDSRTGEVALDVAIFQMGSFTFADSSLGQNLNAELSDLDRRNGKYWVTYSSINSDTSSARILIECDVGSTFDRFKGELSVKSDLVNYLNIDFKE